MRKKDIFLAAFLSFLGVGLGHVYLGEYKRAGLIFIAQIATLVLAGVAMIWISFGGQLFYIVFFLILFWSIYDAVKGAQYINEELEYED